MPADENGASIERQAMELRRAGASFVRIAEQLGLADEVEAYELVTSAIGDTAREPLEISRAIEVDRLDRLMMSIHKTGSKHLNGSHHLDSRNKTTVCPKADPTEQDLGCGSHSGWRGDPRASAD